VLFLLNIYIYYIVYRRSLDKLVRKAAARSALK
jgi:hypothetical protein